MEPQGGNKYLAAYRDETNRTPEEDHSQIVGARSISGLNAERKIFRHRAEGEMFLLTFPYIGLLLHTLLGTILVASGASSLDQPMERNLDAQMRRMARRPIVAGRIEPVAAIVLERCWRFLS